MLIVQIPDKKQLFSFNNNNYVINSIIEKECHFFQISRKNNILAGHRKS